MPKRILRTREAAEYIGLSASTLEKNRRTEGEGPPFVRISPNVVGYDIADLDVWLDEIKAQGCVDGRQEA